MGGLLTSDKIDFKIKTNTRDNREHYKMIKGSIQEEDITITNIYAADIGAPQCKGKYQQLLKGKSTGTQ